MDEKRVKSREVLLGYLGGDKDKLEQYISRLAICHEAADVAERIVRPIYVNENISDEDVCKKAFYGSILHLAAEEFNKDINTSTLYYHITNKTKEWKKEREAKEKAATVVNVQLNITININGENVIELLRKLGHLFKFTFTTTTESHFDGDGTAEVFQLCGSPADMAVILQSIGQELGETSIEKVSYLSKEHGIYLYNIPLSEAIKTAEDESRL